MVCFAGSIGIIGVACVLAVSSGVQGYITSMQDDMLSGNPIVVSEEAYDLSKVMEMADSHTKQDLIEDAMNAHNVVENPTLDELIKIDADARAFVRKRVGL